MRISVFITIFLVLFSSCQNIEKMEKPEDLVPEEKMVQLLTDLAIIRSGSRIYYRKIEEKIGRTPVSSLFEQYGLDSAQFARSTEYYAQNYLIYERIYDSVKSNLEDLKTEYEILREKEEKADSIARIRKKDSLMKLEKNSSRDSLETDTVGVLAQPIN